MEPFTIATLPRLDQMRVDAFMHTGLVRCEPETPVAEIARIFAEKRIHCVIVGGIEHSRAGDRLTWGVVDDRRLLAALDVGDGSVTAAALATPAEPTVDVHEPLDVAVRQLAGHGASHAIVVDKAYPVGVLSVLDVARAVAGG
jgi:predicted transcriptional regulator